MNFWFFFGLPSYPSPSIHTNLSEPKSFHFLELQVEVQILKFKMLKIWKLQNWKHNPYRRRWITPNLNSAIVWPAVLFGMRLFWGFWGFLASLPGSMSVRCWWDRWNYRSFVILIFIGHVVHVVATTNMQANLPDRKRHYQVHSFGGITHCQ